MTDKAGTVWFALNPYDVYDKNEKNYLGKLYSVSFAGITWECTSNNYLTYTLNTTSKKEPDLYFGNINFSPLRIEEDLEDDSYDIELTLYDAADFLNYLLYEYQVGLEEMGVEPTDDEPLFQYKLYNKGKNKKALKHIDNRIEKNEEITATDILELIKMNVL